VFNDVLPRIRRTGGYGASGVEAVAGRVYSRLAGAADMPIRRINKMMYLFSMDPPLPNADIARLMDINQSTLSYVRNLFTAVEIRAFVRDLRITAFGSSEFYIEEVSRKKTGHRKPSAEERPGFPLGLPEKEAAE
jgi:hypothetical protein